jgi:hypothetical protein
MSAPRKMDDRPHYRPRFVVLFGSGISLSHAALHAQHFFHMPDKIPSRRLQ